MTKRFLTTCLSLQFLLVSSTAMASDGGASLSWSEFGATAIYGLLGIGLALAGFFLLELVTPFSIKKELSEDDNTAVGIVVGSMFLGVSIIVAAAII